MDSEVTTSVRPSRAMCPPNGASAKERAANPERDDVMTPRDLAVAILIHFKPTGHFLDPCCGDGAFFNQVIGVESADYCEIKKGRDFLEYDFPDGPRDRFGEIRYDWIITNPPFSVLRAFLQRSMQLADNVVFLCNLNAIIGLKARLRDVREEGFGVKEILLVDTPPVSAGWAQSGFQLAATHLQRGYRGDVKWGSLDL